MRCVKCGQNNPDSASFCHVCGGNLVAGPAPHPPAPETMDRRCVECGRQISWDANVCPYCGKDYRIPHQGGAAQYAPRKTAKPVIAGVLILIAGVVALFPISIMGYWGMGDWLFGLWAFSIGAAVLSFIGGVASITRKYFPLALLGAIASLFGVSVLGIIAIVLVAISYDEFER